MTDIFVDIFVWKYQ